MNQLSIDFNPDISKSYQTVREYVQARVYQIGRQLKAVAADMDLSPSHLNRKLAQSPNDSMKLTVDDLERYIEVTGDIEPVKYLVAKHLYKQKPELLEAQIAELQRQLDEAK